MRGSENIDRQSESELLSYCRLSIGSFFIKYMCTYLVHISMRSDFIVYVFSLYLSIGTLTLCFQYSLAAINLFLKN